MANPEHLAKLKEGVEAWNKWRKDNPKIKRDLTEANLGAANFTGAGNLAIEQLFPGKLSRHQLRGPCLFREVPQWYLISGLTREPGHGPPQ